MTKRFGLFTSVAAVGTVALAALLGGDAGQPVQAQSGPSKPNIIFVILDDVGIDQLKIFNTNEKDPPNTPNLKIIAQNGVKFTNVWAAPECSPSRASMFTGRYALRTGVDAVIVSSHLPQTYMSSFEATLPRVMAKAGYTSALMGKYHLGNDEDPAGNCAPTSRGFNAFNGSMTPGPPSVDTTAGGIDKSNGGAGSQVCGYFQTKNAGACYTAPGDSIRCQIIDSSNSAPGTDPARTCLQAGGIFVSSKACGVGGPKYSDFSRYNAYYVWPRTNLTGPLSPYYVAGNDNACGSTVARTYLTEAQSTDGVSWWKQQTGPRMLTLSYNTIHTPIQKPPTTIVSDPIDRKSTCSNLLPPRDVLNMMIESADVEIGRTLTQLGLATMGADGRTLKSLNLKNTMLVIIGDNGSQGAATRVPFNIQRSKGTVYQTGIWVPLIVAGPLVKQPNRSVDYMINAVDLYHLFGAIGGVDVNALVPPSHTLDAQPMLAYLTNPSQTSIRTTNYAQLGVGTYNPDPSIRSWPCLIGNTCNDTLVDNQPLCENDNGGTWYGPGTTQPSGQLNSCCAVQSWQASHGNPNVTLAPIYQHTIRGGYFRNTLGAFKLVELQGLDCSKPITNASQKAFPWAQYQLAPAIQEFYDTTLKTKTNPEGLDNAGSAAELSQNCPPNSSDLSNCLPTQLDVNTYNALNKKLQAMKNSANGQTSCAAKGDGNMDMRINQADIDGWTAFNGKGPSRYDINGDGKTDDADLAIIQANLGTDCMTTCQRADLNRDGKVTSVDLDLLLKQKGTCTDVIFCSGDLNGDGKVDLADSSFMRAAIKYCK